MTPPHKGGGWQNLPQMPHSGSVIGWRSQSLIHDPALLYYNYMINFEKKCCCSLVVKLGVHKRICSSVPTFHLLDKTYC